MFLRNSSYCKLERSSLSHSRGFIFTWQQSEARSNDLIIIIVAAIFSLQTRVKGIRTERIRNDGFGRQTEGTRLKTCFCFVTLTGIHIFFQTVKRAVSAAKQHPTFATCSIRIQGVNQLQHATKYVVLGHERDRWRGKKNSNFTAEMKVCFSCA